MKYNETRIEELFGRAGAGFGQIRIEQLGRGCYSDRQPNAADFAAAREGRARCAGPLLGGDYDVVILDELTIALHFGLLTEEEVLEALRQRDPRAEAASTGRYAPQALLDAAGLVPEMREEKHYNTQGVLSRDGIDR